MAVFNEPTQWSHELGNNADVSTLPDDTGATTGVASLQKLFQIINQTPLEAGGVAPDREDFNALFKILGDSVFYGMNGGFASYNPAYDYVVGRYVVYNGTLYKCIQTNGASSTVVAPDSVSPLGSDYWVQVATLADFTNFANTDLSNLSASGQALFTNKADKDFSNVSAPVQAFKNMSVNWGMPDYDVNKAIDITASFGSTPTQLTVAKNSWLVMRCGYSGYGAWLAAIYVNGAIWMECSGFQTNEVAMQPIAAGTYTVQCNTMSNVQKIELIPCLGEN